MANISDILRSLDVSNDEAAVYLYLLEHGSFSVGILAKRMGVPRTTLYSMLARLQQSRLLREHTQRGLKSYIAEPPDTLSQLLSERLDSLQHSQQSLAALLPKLRKSYKATVTAPKLSVFEGQSGLENVLNDMLQYSDLETCAVWPIRSMMKSLSPEVFRIHNKVRIAHKLYTRAVWPEKEAVAVKQFPFLGWGPEFQREIRIAPKGMEFSLGYWIYANKVAFLSSELEGCGFIIQSAELVQTLLAQFELLWSNSQPLKFNPKDVAQFIREL